MSAESYVDLHFDDEKIRITVLTNMCRMLLTRGYMDVNKYKRDNKEKQSIVEKVSENDKIDNTLFLPFIEKRTDNGIYMIPLDTPYSDQRDAKEGNTDFVGLQIVVKIIPQSVKDIGNSPILNDFLKSYPNYHKIIVFDAISDKVYNVLSRKKNVEVFDRDWIQNDVEKLFQSIIKKRQLRCFFV